MNPYSVTPTPVPWALMFNHLIRGETTPLSVEFIHSYIQTLGKVTITK